MVFERVCQKAPFVSSLFASPLLSSFSSLNPNAWSDTSKDQIRNLFGGLLLLGYFPFWQRDSQMKFRRSRNSSGLVEEKNKSQQASGSGSGSVSRMKSFLQFFAKKTFLSPKKKLLPAPSTVTSLSLSPLYCKTFHGVTGVWLGIRITNSFIQKEWCRIVWSVPYLCLFLISDKEKWAFLELGRSRGRIVILIRHYPC